MGRLTDDELHDAIDELHGLLLHTRRTTDHEQHILSVTIHKNDYKRFIRALNQVMEEPQPESDPSEPKSLEDRVASLEERMDEHAEKIRKNWQATLK